MNARALRVALHGLSLACIAAALGSSGCYIGCDVPWRNPLDADVGESLEPIAVGGGVSLVRHVVLGRGGEIVTVTYDGTRLSQSGTSTLRAVTGHGWRLVAVGDGGAIVVSDDGGETWSPRSSGTTRDLRAIVSRETAPSLSIAVGDGVVVTSTDGEAWTVLDEPEGGWGSLRGVVSTESRTWLVGDRGVAWSSATLDSWVPESLGTSADLLGISTGHWGVGESDQLIAASETELFLRGPEQTSWRSVTPELDGRIIGFSGGFVLTSKGEVFGVMSGGTLERVPIEIDFVPIAIHGDHERVVVVGREGRVAELGYQPCKGRPLLDAGRSVVARAIERDDWQIDEHESSDAIDEREASRWRRAGLDEHASIASFAVHVLELASLGAPAELVGEVMKAMADEVRHAASSFGLARRFSGVGHGPGRLALGSNPAARCGDLQAIALAVFEQGCIGETLAACEADVDAQTSSDSRARAVLEPIALDERRHAALAWSTLRWLLERDPSLREPLRRRLSELANIGRSPIHEATLRELIVPLATRMSAQPENPATNTSAA